jgi:hypothetical protein
MFKECNLKRHYNKKHAEKYENLQGAVTGRTLWRHVVAPTLV